MIILTSVTAILAGLWCLYLMRQRDNLDRELTQAREDLRVAYAATDGLQAQLDARKRERDEAEEKIRLWRDKYLDDEQEIERLKEAIDKARRESASDPESRWARNATIILNAALAPPATLKEEKP